MRIAYVLPMTWACGGTIAPFSQVNELVTRGHDVTVFAARGEPVDWFPLRAPLLSLPRSSADAVSFDVAVFVGDTFRIPSFLEAKCRFLLLQGKDYLLTPGAKRAFLTRAYGDPQFHILAVSEWLAAFVREKFDKTRVTVVGNGIDPHRFFPDMKPPAGTRLLIEGNFPDPHKNVIDAIEAASRVRQHQNVEVWAMGRRFVSPGSLVDRIFENPPQEAIPAIYRQCDVLLKTSVMEGFGLPHLEAMACGCVPVTYASGGILDFCKHEVNSLLVGVGNLPLLVWQVLRFLSAPDLRARLREGAIATARSRTWSSVADHIEKVFLRASEDAV